MRTMREYLEKATQDIAFGLDPDVVIDVLLVEKSMWKPKAGYVGGGAAAAAAIQGGLAHLDAKNKGLKGKERTKHIAKAAAKGAVKGAVTGYAGQLLARGGHSLAAERRHIRRGTGKKAAESGIPTNWSSLDTEYKKKNGKPLKFARSKEGEGRQPHPKSKESKDPNTRRIRKSKLKAKRREKIWAARGFVGAIGAGLKGLSR